MKSAELKGISNYKHTHKHIHSYLIYFCSPDLEKFTKYKTLKLTHLMRLQITDSETNDV